MKKGNQTKVQIILLVSLLVVISLVIALIYWNAESQVKIKGLALDEQGKIAQGLYVLAFEGNTQIGSSLSFTNSSLEGQTPTSPVLAAKESNFELKFLDKYGFPARTEYVEAIQAKDSKYISSPSGQTLQLVVLRDLSQITSIIPKVGSTSGPEPPAIVKFWEYVKSLGPIGAIVFIVILGIVAIVTGIFKRVTEIVVEVVEKRFRSVIVPPARFGTVETVNIEKGQLIVSFAENTKVENGTRLLIRGETIDRRSSKVARPIIGTATIYGLLENNRYWALIDKIHQEATQSAKFKITKQCEVETYISDEKIPQIGLASLNLNDKGRIYKIENIEIFVNIGSEQSVRKEMILEVVEPQIDLDGKYLGDSPIAELKVAVCEAEFSKCSVVNKRKEIRLDALVRIKKA